MTARPDRSLFERLGGPPGTADTGTGGGRSLHALAESIVGNIERILASPRGCAAAADDYGIPDVCQLIRESPPDLRAFAAAVRVAIESYEPRLAHVAVRFADADGRTAALGLLTLAMQITGRIDQQSTNQKTLSDRLSITAEVSPCGEIELAWRVAHA